jgi:DNA-binding LacI/PurR family transcriptional regulator
MAVTQDDVAARAGVSRALVSMVMRDSPQVSAPKREAVRRAALELGYRPNVNAALLARHRTMMLGVVVPDMLNPVFFQLLVQIEAEAGSQGYAVLPALGDMTTAQEHAAVDRFMGHRVDGVILIGTRLAAGEVQALSRQVPIAVVGCEFPCVASAAVDSEGAGRMATNHLIELGHRRIVHIDGGENPGCPDRRRGYLQAMRDANLAGYARVVAGDGTEAGGEAAAAELLTADEPPSAIFAANDLTALGVLAAAKQRAVRVPEDLSVVGFDNTPLSMFRFVDLTTIAQPIKALADSAVHSLLDAVEKRSGPGGNLALHPPSLVVRGSTAPVTQQVSS